MQEINYITVRQLNLYINNIFANELLLHNVPVVGEVSDCKTVAGNCFFTLKDEQSQIKIVLYGCNDKYVPYNGEMVLVRGRVDYYQKSGLINVKAYSVTPFGKGALYEKLERLKRNLIQEGLFDESRKKVIPSICKKVALLTSVKGAALHDFLSTLEKNHSKPDIDIVDVRVQGENCATDIITALINCDPIGYDVIVICRGGGSFEDLYCFNDENLIRCIAGINTPVISAVGHETDYTLCDFVADYRAITPTAAAEKISFNISEQKRRLREDIVQLKDALEDIKINAKDTLLSIGKNLTYNVKSTITHNKFMVKNKVDLLKITNLQRIERKRNEIQKITQRIEDISPIKLLNKGYFRIVAKQNVIHSLDEIEVNDEITISSDKYRIKANVTNKETL